MKFLVYSFFIVSLSLHSADSAAPVTIERFGQIINCYRSDKMKAAAVLQYVRDFPLPAIESHKPTVLHLLASAMWPDDIARDLLAVVLKKYDNSILDACDQNDVTPVHIAAVFSPSNMLPLLLAQNASPTATDKNKRKPLHCAALHNSHDAVYLLCRQKANEPATNCLHSLDVERKNPLQCSIDSFALQSFNLLLNLAHSDEQIRMPIPADTFYAGGTYLGYVFWAYCKFAVQNIKRPGAGDMFTKINPIAVDMIKELLRKESVVNAADREILNSCVSKWPIVEALWQVAQKTKEQREQSEEDTALIYDEPDVF